MSKKIQKLTKRSAEMLDDFFSREEVSEELDDDFILTMADEYGDKKGYGPAIKTLTKLIKLKEDKPEQFYLLRLLYPDGEVVSMKEEESEEEESEEESEEETPVISKLKQIEEGLYGNTTEITRLENELQSSDDEEGLEVLSFLKGLSNEPDDDIKDLLSKESSVRYTIDKDVYKFNEARNELEKIIDKAKEKDNLGILDTQ